MASVQTASYQNRYIKLTVEESSYDISANTSTLYWKVESIGGNANYYDIYTCKAIINGQEVFNIKNLSGYKSSKDCMPWDSYKFPAAKGSMDGYIYNVYHNADGTGGPISFTLYGKVYNAGSVSYSGSVNLTTLPRASTPSISANPTSGNSITIYTNRASSSFTHTIEYYFGNRSGTIATGVGDNCSWTPSNDLCDQIPNSTQGNGTIRCHTYNGGTYIGTKDIGFTLYANGNLVPSISAASFSEGNSAISALNWGVYIKSKSYPLVACTAAGVQGSTIKKYILEYYTGSTYVKSLEGSSLSDLNTKIVSSFDKTNQYTYKIKVTDSRGRSAWSSSIAFTMVDYTAPTIGTNYSASRCDSSGTAQDDGTYLKCMFTGGISSVSGHNPLTVKIGIKQRTAPDYTYTTYVNGDTTINSFDYTGAAYKLLSNVDDDKTYDVIFIVSDQFTDISRTLVVSTAFVLIDFNPSGHGIAFGKSSEKDAMEVGMDLDVKKAIYIDGVKTIWYE